MRNLILAITIGLVAVGCGGSGNGDPTGGMIAPPPTTVTMQQVQAQVFSTSCALSGCHQGAGAPFGLDLAPGNAFGNLVNVPSAEISMFMRVEPFNAADSYLYMKVTNDPRIFGDPMPFLAGPLSPDKVALIEDWIEQGANP